MAPNPEPCMRAKASGFGVAGVGGLWRAKPQHHPSVFGLCDGVLLLAEHHNGDASDQHGQQREYQHTATTS